MLISLSLPDDTAWGSRHTPGLTWDRHPATQPGYSLSAYITPTLTIAFSHPVQSLPGDWNLGPQRSWQTRCQDGSSSKRGKKRPLLGEGWPRAHCGPGGTHSKSHRPNISDTLTRNLFPGLCTRFGSAPSRVVPRTGGDGKNQHSYSTHQGDNHQHQVEGGGQAAALGDRTENKIHDVGHGRPGRPPPPPP